MKRCNIVPKKTAKVTMQSHCIIVKKNLKEKKLILKTKSLKCQPIDLFFLSGWFVMRKNVVQDKTGHEFSFEDTIYMTIFHCMTSSIEMSQC